MGVGGAETAKFVKVSSSKFPTIKYICGLQNSSLHLFLNFVCFTVGTQASVT